MEADTIKQEEMKENKRKNISGEPENYSRQTIYKNLIKK